MNLKLIATEPATITPREAFRMSGAELEQRGCEVCMAEIARRAERRAAKRAALRAANMG
jgi:hypothetical protein